MKKDKYYKATIGNQIEIHGKGEAFKQGMDYLQNSMSIPHSFICLKCGEMWLTRIAKN